MDAVSVSFLGSGDAFNAGGRHHAAYLVRGRDSVLLLDCGATALASLQRDRIATGDIDTVLISHLHGDHFAGLPFLFLEFIWVTKRSRPLRIVGPAGTEERVVSVFRAMYPGSAGRPLPFQIVFHEVKPDETLCLDSVKIRPFQVPHQERAISLGFALAVDGRRIVYSGDTGWTEDLVTHASGADLFLCECSFFETRMWSHLDYPRLAENRQRFEVKRMVLTHLGLEVLARREEVEMQMAEDRLIIRV